MKTNLSRRSFVKRSALDAGFLSATSFNNLNAANAGDTIRFLQIGCGGRGARSHLPELKDEHLAAIVDVDENKHATVKKWLQGKGGDPSNLPVFTDYRKMFDKVAKDIDAVF